MSFGSPYSEIGFGITAPTFVFDHLLGSFRRNLFSRAETPSGVGFVSQIQENPGTEAAKQTIGDAGTIAFSLYGDASSQRSSEVDVVESVL